MKKLLSTLLALMVVMSAFMGLGFAVSAESTDTLAVTVNGITTEIPVGEKFTYTYTMTDLSIVNVEASLNYDSDALSLTTVDIDADEYDAYVQSSFPVIYNSVIFNDALNDKIPFIFSFLDGYSFVGEQALASFEFTALAAGETTIEMQILEMVGTDKGYYVKKSTSGGTLEREFTYGESITYDAPEVPTEEPTEVPSEEPTETPTEAPTTEVENPTKVENVTAGTVTEDTIEISWDSTTNAVKYWVIVDGATYTSTTDTSCTIKKRSAGTTYEISVIALLTDGTILKAADADVVSVTTVEKQPASSVDTTEISATISWNVADATKTWIYFGKSADSVKIMYSTTSDSYTITGLDAGTTYYYKLRHLVNGVIVEGEIGEFTTASETVPAVSAVYEDGALTLTWNQAYGSYKYWVTVETGEKALVYSTTDTSYTINNFDTDNYTVSVKAACNYNGTFMMFQYDAPQIAV